MVVVVAEVLGSPQVEQVVAESAAVGPAESQLHIMLAHR
jgi:hypothetical protein